MVPDNVDRNIEVWPSGLFRFPAIRDDDLNVRPDGSERGIVRQSFTEGHTAVDDGGSAAMDYVIEQTRAHYPEP